MKNKQQKEIGKRQQ